MPTVEEHLTPSREEIHKKLVQRETILRDQWVGVMEARLVREELIKCRKSEGVNSYVECKHLADLYLTLLKDAKVSGWRKGADKS